MKKVFYVVMAIVVMVAFVLAMSSCNMGLVGKFTYNGIHLTTHDGRSMCLKVEKWYESDTGIEVKTENKKYGSIFASEGTYILFKDACPICGEAPKE